MLIGTCLSHVGASRSWWRIINITVGGGKFTTPTYGVLGVSNFAFTRGAFLSRFFTYVSNIFTMSAGIRCCWYLGSLELFEWRRVNAHTATVISTSCPG